MTFAFVFPGQGSQSVGMLNSIADRPEVRATLQEASEASCKVSRTSERSAIELSIPTDWEPWPGNTNANVIEVVAE